MFGMTEPGEPSLVGKARVLGDLIEHALVQLRPLPGHAGLEFVTAANGGVNKKMKLHAPCSLFNCRGAPRAPNGGLTTATHVYENSLAWSNRTAGRISSRRAGVVGELAGAEDWQKGEGEQRPPYC